MNQLRRLPAFLLVGVLGGGALDAREPIRMQVSPSVARAPADLVVRISIDASAENRLLKVIAESPTFYRSSEISIDGEHAAPLNVFEFRELPSGVYEVTGVLVDVHGRRMMVSRVANVQPPFGR